MNYIDIIFLLAFVWGAYNGYENGFIVQSLSLIAFILGIWAGYKFSGYASEMLLHYFHINGKLLPIIAFSAVFLFVLISVHFIGKLLTSLIGETVIGTLNRIGGIAFGILKMAFIISIFIFILEKIDVQNRLIAADDKRKSLLFEPVKKIAPAVFPFLHFEEIKNGLLNV